MTENLTHDELKKWVSYDPDTGVFTRISFNKNYKSRVGKPWGTLTADGRYLRGQIDRKSFALHRLAWLYHYGVWPAGVIDHINRIGTDNRIANLRDVNARQNGINHIRRKPNSIGVRGVYERCGRFRTFLNIGGKQAHLGTFDTVAEAFDVYVNAVAVEYGQVFADEIRLQFLQEPVENVTNPLHRASVASCSVSEPHHRRSRKRPPSRRLQECVS